MLSYFWNDDPLLPAKSPKRHPAGNSLPFAETHEAGVKGYTEDKKIIIETSNGTFTMEEDLLALSGTHNLYNSLASGIAPNWWIIHDENLRASLSDFTGVEHRLEKVARVLRSRFYQRLESYECKLLLVCLAEHDHSAGLDTGWNG